MSRFNLLLLLRGQWRSLKNRADSRRPVDVIAVAIMYGIPLLVGCWVYFLDICIRNGTVMLTGAALLAGGLLTSFTHLSTLRLKLTERAETYETTEKFDRDTMDEVATHLLNGTAAAALTAVSLIIALNSTSVGNGAISGFWAALSMSLGSYVVLVFLGCIPQLYQAYLNLNSVDSEMSGVGSKSRRRR